MTSINWMCRAERVIHRASVRACSQPWFWDYFCLFFFFIISSCFVVWFVVHCANVCTENIEIERGRGGGGGSERTKRKSVKNYVMIWLRCSEITNVECFFPCSSPQHRIFYWSEPFVSFRRDGRVLHRTPPNMMFVLNEFDILFVRGNDDEDYYSNISEFESNKSKREIAAFCTAHSVQVECKANKCGKRRRRWRRRRSDRSFSLGAPYTIFNQRECNIQLWINKTTL